MDVTRPDELLCGLFLNDDIPPRCPRPSVYKSPAANPFGEWPHGCNQRSVLLTWSRPVLLFLVPTEPRGQSHIPHTDLI